MIQTGISFEIYGLIRDVVLLLKNSIRKKPISKKHFIQIIERKIKQKLDPGGIEDLILDLQEKNLIQVLKLKNGREAVIIGSVI